MTRTIPTKERVLKVAEQYPQAKAALEILFPQDFEVPIVGHIEQHFAIIRSAVLMSPAVAQRVKRGSWTAKYGCRGPSEILKHPMFEDWVKTYTSGQDLLDLVAAILALEVSS